MRATLGENVVLLPDPTVEQLRSTVKETVPAVRCTWQASTCTRPLASLGLEIPDGTATCWPISADNRCRSRRSASAGSRLRRPEAATGFATSMTQPLVSPQWPSPRAPRAAVGFQDSVDDALAELFFSRFYAIWTGLNAQPKDRRTAQVTRAFVRTLDDLRSRPVS